MNGMISLNRMNGVNAMNGYCLERPGVHAFMRAETAMNTLAHGNGLISNDLVDSVHAFMVFMVNPVSAESWCRLDDPFMFFAVHSERTWAEQVSRSPLCLASPE